MTPLDQQFLHQPDDGQQGDCMRAVLGSLLDIPIVDVPHFAQLDADGAGNFWIMVAEFCRSHGYAFAMFKGGRFSWSEDAVYHGIGGVSPRDPNGHHAVVGRNGQVFHDPHPTRDGLAGDPADWYFYFLTRP